MNRDQINGLVRHTMTGAGIAGVTASHDDLIQLFGALVTFLSIVWSFLEKRQAARAAAAAPPAGGSGPTSPMLPLLLLCGLAFDSIHRHGAGAGVCWLSRPSFSASGAALASLTPGKAQPAISDCS